MNDVNSQIPQTKEQQDALARVNWFITDLKQQEFDDIGIWLKIIGISRNVVLPQHASIISKYKHEIIETILLYMERYDTSSSTIEDMVHALKSMGVTWSELDEISFELTHRSVNEAIAPSAKDLENYARNNQHKSEVREVLIKLVKQHFDENSPFIALYNINKFNMKMHDWPEIADMVEYAKYDYISSMVEHLSTLDGLVHVDRVLKQLRNVGVTWEELDTIEEEFTAQAAYLGYIGYEID